MTRSRIALISANIAALAGAIVFAVAAPMTGSTMVNADDGGTSQPPPPPPPAPDGHGWIG